MKPYEEWIDRAISAFDIASVKVSENVYYEDLCAYAQQAAEKAIKGLLVYYGEKPAHTHNLRLLLDDLKKYTDIDEKVKEARHLTKYANQTKYPGDYIDVPEEEYKRALKIAENCIDWVEKKIEENKENSYDVE